MNESEKRAKWSWKREKDRIEIKRERERDKHRESDTNFDWNPLSHCISIGVACEQHSNTWMSGLIVLSK